MSEGDWLRYWKEADQGIKSFVIDGLGEAARNIRLRASSEKVQRLARGMRMAFGEHLENVVMNTVVEEYRVVGRRGWPSVRDRLAGRTAI